ncbi:MAG: hypothetical protein HY906_02095 [Deltaproteobacteria bacterium]|nr:hypothetical protein [Deltaproteobacteria bacterium]
MRDLTLGDLKMGLGNLLEGQTEALTASAIGRTYGALLAARREEIEALPAPLTEGLPLSGELAHADGVHDALGTAIWHLCTAYMEHPRMPPRVQDAASRCREALIPSLGVLRRSYADEAAAALSRRAAISGMEPDLSIFPVADGKSLLDWALAYIDQGERLHGLLSARADAVAAVDGQARRRAAQLRSETVELLGHFRNALADEMAADPGLPRDLDARIFGFFDQLARRRAK